MARFDHQTTLANQLHLWIGILHIDLKFIGNWFHERTRLVVAVDSCNFKSASSIVSMEYLSQSVLINVYSLILDQLRYYPIHNFSQNQSNFSKPCCSSPGAIYMPLYSCFCRSVPSCCRRHDRYFVMIGLKFDFMLAILCSTIFIFSCQAHLHSWLPCQCDHWF